MDLYKPCPSASKINKNIFIIFLPFPCIYVPLSSPFELLFWLPCKDFAYIKNVGVVLSEEYEYIAACLMLLYCLMFMLQECGRYRDKRRCYHQCMLCR